MPSATAVRDRMSRLDALGAAMAAGHFSIFCNAIRAAHAAEDFRRAEPFTLFAPTDAAFQKWSREALGVLLKDRVKLAAILRYHVIDGMIPRHEITNGAESSWQGETLNLTVGDDGLRVNEAKIVKAEIEASNGIVHGIDTVLLPACYR